MYLVYAYVIAILEKLRQENPEFKVSMSCIKQ